MASEEMRVLQKLLKEIEELKFGLDPTVLGSWYTKVESDAKAKAPLHLRDSIQVVQNEILPMKFEIRNCNFPAAGLYWVEVMCDGSLLARKKLFLRA